MHTDVFGCGFDAVFGEIIRQKQKYPYKPAPNGATPFLFYSIDIIRRSLINEIVKPVGEQQICMRPPRYKRLL